MATAKLTLPERLLSHVQIITDTGCWIWLAYLNEDGYGIVRAEGASIGAHIASYTVFVGPVPDGLELDHTCRVRCCINPRHLEPVTHGENIRRGDAAKNKRKITHCPRNHPYDQKNTYTNKRGLRSCKECKRTRERETYARDRHTPPHCL